ncbi:ATP-dependent RNA helicase A [Cottoperca gobio]|uniref:ATP-dependent RNA helicase A n=1 Tax=Cottoperca gobio TaxID=56716 RepID=A0A6J2PAA7_COTGO|nr:ATP-dependent RNA helicase A [Cottoperca gobio]
MRCAPSPPPRVSRSLSSARANVSASCTETSRAAGSPTTWLCCPSSRPGTTSGLTARTQKERFCEHKRLNMSTLRMTWEAKVQLKDILVNAGFPEECLMTQMFNTVGPDNNLDVVVSLLTFGSYPNVCYHKEKRKILTTEGRNALIHKSSVNCPFSSHDMTYPSPFFVFSEKIRTRAISAKGMTLVSPLQLLLFACQRITSDGDVVVLDDWIKLRIPHEAAGGVAALRAGLEALVVEVSKDPEYIRQMDPSNQQLLNIIRLTSKPSAAGLNLMVNNQRMGDGPRPPKMARFDGGGGYRGGYGGGGYRGGGAFRDTTCLY